MLHPHSSQYASSIVKPISGLVIGPSYILHSPVVMVTAVHCISSWVRWTLVDLGISSSILNSQLVIIILSKVIVQSPRCSWSLHHHRCWPPRSTKSGCWQPDYTEKACWELKMGTNIQHPITLRMGVVGGHPITLRIGANQPITIRMGVDHPIPSKIHRELMCWGLTTQLHCE